LNPGAGVTIIASLDRKGGAPMAKIYVSSTFVDLQECRERVSRVLRQMGHEDVGMEYYVAEDQRPVDKCLRDVAACDVYVGLFAWRYGWVPKAKNRKRHSLTEMEFRQAVQSGKQCLTFVLDGKTAWPPDFIDDDKTRIKKLRAELGEEHGAVQFTSPDHLTYEVSVAVRAWEYKHGHIPAAGVITELELEPYFNALRKRYQRIDLEGLTPPQREEYLQLLLRSVFVGQSVREDRPPVELSRERWKWLRSREETHSDDLPEDLGLDKLRRAREVYDEKPLRPVLDVLTDSRYPYVVILGDPGSGKSTLSRYVLLSLIDAVGDETLRLAFDGYLPLLIELRSYVGLCADQKCDTFLEYLEYLGQTEGWRLKASALEHHLNNKGRALVIFDGLDEIFDPEQREQVMHRMVGFAASYPNVRIIATSRIIGYRRKILADAEFAHFTLQDLDESQVATFAERWYELALSDRPDEAKERRERILRAFKDSASIRQLAGNPMLLTIMAIIAMHQELPRERWKLYDHAATVLIEHWDINKHLDDHNVPAEYIGQDEKKEMLRRLAHRMQSGAGGLAGNYVHRDELQDEFESYLKERFDQPPDRRTAIARAMIQQFCERNFILSLYGGNLYGFVHSAFLEYFCAAAFVYRFEKAQSLTLDDLQQQVYGAHWEDRNWHEVLRLICSIIDEEFAGALIDYLLAVPDPPRPEEYETRPPWHVVLAIRCFSELKKTGASADSAKRLLEAVCALFEAQVQARDAYDTFLLEQVATPAAAIGTAWPHRAMVANWLREYKPFNSSFMYAKAFGTWVGAVGAGLPTVQQIVLDYAAHSDARLRLLAAHTLLNGWRADPATTLALPVLAVKDWDWQVRHAAASAMGEHDRDDERPLALLRDWAVKDGDGDVRSRAMNLIVEHYRDDERTLLLLHERAVNDDQFYVRHAALTALIKYYRDNAQTFPMLRDRAVKDSDWQVRSMAISEISEHYRSDEHALPLLRDRALQDDSPSHADLPWKAAARHLAIEAIAKYWPAHPDTLPLLRERAENDPTRWLRKRAKELADELEAT
jgi:hypothetical protein